MVRVPLGAPTVRRHDRDVGVGQRKSPRDSPRSPQFRGIMDSMTVKICSVEGCDRPKDARGWCKKHHKYWLRNGRPTKPSTEERFWMNVHKTDGHWLWTGALDEHGYGNFSAPGLNAKSPHRAVLEITTGKEVPDGMVVDHLCHTPACVNPDHLRVTTHKENMRNRKYRKPTDQAPARGVERRISNKGEVRYRARVSIDSRWITLGTFDTLEEAAAVANAKREEIYGTTGVLALENA